MVKHNTTPKNEKSLPSIEPPSMSDSPFISLVEQDLPRKNIPYPTANDVRCGKGQGANYHRGCRDLRATVEIYLPEFARLPRSGREADKKKRNIASNIVKHFREVRNSRFLRQNPETDLWDDIGDEAAEDKVLQLLRDLKKKKKRPYDAMKRGGEVCPPGTAPVGAEGNSTETGMGNGICVNSSAASCHSAKSHSTVQYHYSQIMDMEAQNYQVFTGKHRRNNSEISSEMSNSVATTHMADCESFSGIDHSHPSSSTYRPFSHNGVHPNHYSVHNIPTHVSPMTAVAFSDKLQINNKSPSRRMHQSPSRTVVRPATVVTTAVMHSQQYRVAPLQLPSASSPSSPQNKNHGQLHQEQQQYPHFAPPQYLMHMGVIPHSNSDQNDPPSPFTPPRRKRMSYNNEPRKGKEIYASRPAMSTTMSPPRPKYSSPSRSRQAKKASSENTCSSSKPEISFKRHVWEKLFDSIPSFCGRVEDVHGGDDSPEDCYRPHNNPQQQLPHQIDQHHQGHYKIIVCNDSYRQLTGKYDIHDHHQYQRQQQQQQMVPSSHPQSIRYLQHAPTEYQEIYPQENQHVYPPQQHHHHQRQQPQHLCPYPVEFNSHHHDPMAKKIRGPPPMHNSVSGDIPQHLQQHFPEKRMDIDYHEDKSMSSCESSAGEKKCTPAAGITSRGPSRQNSGSSHSSNFLEFVSNDGDIFSSTSPPAIDSKTIAY